ncbi:MAG: hypothetical protein ABL893_16220 [Hyphomicrobium sp.]
MKYITLIAMLGVTLIVASGGLPKGSVGGPMMLTLIFLCAALAAGLYEAWSARRGVVGWIVSVVVAFFGGLVGAFVGAMILESLLVLLLPFMKLEGSLMTTGGLPLYIDINAQMIFTMLGAWGALQLVNRWR